MQLRRFWFKFVEADGLPPGMQLGCGVTAWSIDDAVAMLSRIAFGGAPPPFADIVEDVDVSSLDAKHVLPNIGPPHTRGIWYPMGYS